MVVELTSETMHALFEVVDYHCRCRLEDWKTKIQSIVRIIKKDSKYRFKRGSEDPLTADAGGQPKPLPWVVGSTTLYQCSWQSIDIPVMKIL
jgi:hypothetical protein